MILLRWLGSRTIGQLSSIEFLLVIALGSAVGDAMFYPDVPLLHALAVITIVVFANKGLDLLVSKSRRAEVAVDGKPLEAIRDGTINRSFLEGVGMTNLELFQQLRANGVEDLGQVRRAYLETNGTLSVFKTTADWRADRQREQQTTGRGIFVPLSFRPGEAFQFDWSEDYAVIGGERTKLQVAHIKLSHSRAFLVRAYLLQTHEMLFDAHWHGFRVFGGVPARGIYDNMKTAVDRVGRGKERQINIRFLAMTNHYVFAPEFCNPAAGWEKGQVEKNVQDARPRLWQQMPDFPDLAALNLWLEQHCQDLWQETPHGSLPGSIADVWGDEQPALMALPAMFDGFVEQSKRVSPTCLITFERNRYSVPASFANRPVSLRIYPERLVVAAEGNILCEHPRIIERSHDKPPRTIYDWRHYLTVIQRKPGALRNGAPFLELPLAFRQLQDQMLRRLGGDREMADILALVLHHDEQVVVRAVELALDQGVATKTHVLNLLHRLIDGKTTDGPDIDTPQALTLLREPKANVERYDGLRVRIVGGRHAS
ncbi:MULTISPECIES: IS21 family transposase [unclassified Shinella]|uniref:IS21 family transposase n=1 Tax=unclassified Shinella TaxID=2643062 RepID=UPI00300F287A